MRDHDNIYPDVMEARQKHERSFDSYPAFIDFVPEKAAQVSGFQLYRSPESEQTWLVSGDFKKRGFVTRTKQELMDEVRVRMARARKEREAE